MSRCWKHGRSLLGHEHQTQEEPAVRDQPRQAAAVRGNLFRSSIRWWQIFNCSSLKYLLPCGGDDRNVIEGDLRLGIADGT